MIRLLEEFDKSLVRALKVTMKISVRLWAVGSIIWFVYACSWGDTSNQQKKHVEDSPAWYMRDQ